jgi:hypothetical protein
LIILPLFSGAFVVPEPEMQKTVIV